jgi:hypothetical protein
LRHRLPTRLFLASLLFAGCEEPLEPEVLDEQAAEEANPEDLLTGRIEAAQVAGIVRSDLTNQLQEYALQMGFLAHATIHGDPTGNIRGEVDATIDNLSDTIGVLFGPTVGYRFYQIWAPTPDLYIRYAKAVKTNNSTEKAAVKAALDKWMKDTTDLLVNANPYVSRAYLSATYPSPNWVNNGRLWFLKEDITLAIETQVPGAQYEYAQYRRWRGTTYKVQFLAEHLVAATEKKNPSLLAGDGNAPGAEYRVALSYLFAEFAYMGAWEIRTRVNEASYPSYARNEHLGVRYDIGLNLGGYPSSDPSLYVAPVYDIGFRDQYWSTMSTYVSYLTVYVRERREGDSAGATAARNALYTWTGTFASLFANKNPYVDRAWLQAEARAFVDEMLLIADRQITGDTRWYWTMADTEDRLARMGAELAIDIETHRPTQVATWSTHWHP